MNKLGLLVFFLYCSVFIGQAQEVLEYWENGKLKVEGFLQEGERDGEWIEWHSNGNIKQEGIYKNGKLDGVWKYYCIHGYIERVGYWKENLCNRIVYYFFDGLPYVYINFQEGISPEVYLQLYSILKSTHNIQLNFYKEITGLPEEGIHGLAEARASERILGRVGIPMEKRVYLVDESVLKLLLDLENIKFDKLRWVVQNQRQATSFLRLNFKGELVEYLSVDGVGGIEENYVDYYETSPFGRFSEVMLRDSILIEKIEYHHAVDWYQTCTRYYNNGQVESKGDFENGKPTGKWLYFDNNGNILKKDVFKNGQVKKSTVYPTVYNGSY